MTPAELEAAKYLLAYYGYQYPPGGSFTTKLIECMEKADVHNKARLLSAFPEYRSAVGIMNGLGADALDRLVNNTVAWQRQQQQKRPES